MKNNRINLPAASSVRRPDFDGMAALWTLRILIDLEGWRRTDRFLNELVLSRSILRIVGLEQLEEEELNKPVVLRELKKRKRQLEKLKPEITGEIVSNLNRLGEVIGLNHTELQVLLFTAILPSVDGLKEATDSLGELNVPNALAALSSILGVEQQKIQSVLAEKSLLSRSGLLRLSRMGAEELSTKLELMDGLDDVLFEPHGNVLEMLNSYFYPAKGGTLEANDFIHINEDYQLLKRYLSRAKKKHLEGVNILIYGRPGTGKTELVYSLAKDACLDLYSIGMCDEAGDAVSGKRRFSAYQLSQYVLTRQQQTLVLFDEIEDVFPSDFEFGLNRNKEMGSRKAWINRLLEENPSPAVWISNSVDHIDPAFIRRFDYVLKLDHPPKNVRVRILQKHLKNLSVSKQWIEKIAENPEIAPAFVARSARVASVVKNRNTSAVEAGLERLMGNTLEAMGYRTTIKSSRESALPYNLKAVNPDQDLKKLLSGLRKHAEARLCLYGPPGTGKTEFGRFVAKALGKELLVKRGSDLLRPYVGQTEMEISAMFREADKTSSVLLLDEADSFLRDRSLAGQGWEVTQVNELLTQMEVFEGIFICSTNLMDNIDSASLRRFDLKIKFNYLQPEQVWLLFSQTMKLQQQPLPRRKTHLPRLGRYQNLTPGDFTNVMRQGRLSGEALTAEKLLEGLERESLFKLKGVSNPIGFIA